MIAAITLFFAQIVVSTPKGIVTAHDGRVELHRGWSTSGVENASFIVTGENRIAVVDALEGQARIVELANGRGSLVRAGETPVDGAFAGDTLFLLDRDASALINVETRASLRLAADPAFLRVANRKLYVYSRREGIIQEIDRFAITRTIRVAPFAADFETDGRTGYLAYPRDAKIRTFSIDTMKTTGEFGVGAVPADIALSSRMVAVADPSAKKVWVVEGRQTFAQAFARGFLRGLLGLGLYSNRTSQFPTGVDRVMTRGSTWLAYDSSSGTLYRYSKSKSSVIAKGVGPKAFAITGDGIAIWQNGALRLVP